VLDPDNIKALLSLGDIYHGKGDRERAFDVYQRAVNTAPKFARAHISLGSTALELNRIAVAKRALETAVALGGSQQDLHFNLGVLAEQRGDRATAAREYRAEVAAFPDSVEAWVNLGLLERQAGRAAAALAAFERAAGAKADRFEGPFLMAETLGALGRWAEATRWAEEAVRRAPAEPRAQELLARLKR
jgi:tetratricopeptide (TPR) repeat protein